MAEGFIKLYRQLQEHSIWLDEPFTKGQAWVDLVLMVNHKEGQWFNGATFETIERGAVITSEVKLSERWKWSRSKVRNFLGLLEKASMIEQKKNSKRTYLKIVQYCVWQDLKTSKEQQKDSAETSKEHLRDTNKNVKNVNNEKNIGGADKNQLTPQQLDCIRKKKIFYDSLVPFVDKYGKDMIRKFFDHWSEMNKSKTKMKWERENTWEVGLRLSRWEDNNLKWGKGTTQPQGEKSFAAGIIAKGKS